ncbi:MAG: hypothetical protein MUO82_10835 [Candidatus Thermoplasmatota archaeon]|nr:hypothetical protein [Candidatus Thermoplasmatota archaeon]
MRYKVSFKGKGTTTRYYTSITYRKKHTAQKYADELNKYGGGNRHARVVKYKKRKQI